MKKLIFSVMAIAALFVTSCVQDVANDAQVAVGGEATVSFSVESAQLGSRAYGVGAEATDLYYAVYNNGTLLDAISKMDEPVKLVNGTTQLNLKLATGLTYDFIFWAAAPAAWNNIYTIDWATQKMTIDPAKLVAQDETLDAFWKKVTITVTGNSTEGVELKRPFAQVNVAANQQDVEDAAKAGLEVAQTQVKILAFTELDLFTGEVAAEQELTYVYADQAVGELNGRDHLAMVYVLVNEYDTVPVTFNYTSTRGAECTLSVPMLPVQRNYKTNIVGNILTSSNDFVVEIKPEFDAEFGVDANGDTYAKVDTAEELTSALNSDDVDVIILDDDIDLNELFASLQSRTQDDPSLTIKADKTLTLDLNEKSLSATSAQSGKNYNMFNVYGTLTVKNGTIEYEHKGENMGWNASTNIFHVEGGTLNLEGVTAKNLGGSDMGFVAHLNNWSNNALTLNVENSTLESNYVPVRVFNSGPRMNNVDIKNSTLKGGNYAFWVHNYTVEDFGTEAKAESQKALLNLNIYNQGNSFTPDVNGIRYGFTNSIKTDAYGITKVVSEDGTIVTLGSVVENGLIRRGVAGAEENTTIKKVVVEEGVGVLYDRTFRRYYALEEVVLPSTLTVIGEAGSGVFQSCSNLKSIVLPENLTVLGKGSFQECTSLETINIPAGVTRIESDCLRNTGLVEVEFHAGVTYFGAQAFRDCKQLTKVVINAPEFTMEGNTFGIMAAPYTPMTIEVANAEMKAYVESKLTAHCKTYITVKCPTTVTTVEELTAAFESNKTVILGASLEDGSIKLPATLNNFTLRAAAGVVLKNFTISAADGNAYHYDGLTFDGLTFDNSRIVLTGWRNGEEVLKNLTITNCVFKNIDDTSNNAAVHINKDAAEAVENFTFTNNVINNATGGSKSGVYAQVTGKVVFENNVINNVSFRPYVIQITTDDGIADSFSVKGNTFSGSASGRAQGLGNNDAGTDAVNLVVSGNIFKDITEAQQICYWNFNAEYTTADLSKNYYSIDIEANPSRIYYNRAASSVEDLKEMGIYPFYTELNADGTINLNSLKQAE